MCGVQEVYGKSFKFSLQFHYKLKTVKTEKKEKESGGIYSKLLNLNNDNRLKSACYFQSGKK